MQRRDFIKSVAAAGIVGTVGRHAHTAETGWRQFEITYRINIKDSDADTKVRLWVPVPQDALDYQRVLDLSWRSPVATHVLWEAASRAPIVSAIWIDPKIAREIEITAQVATRDRSGFYPDASHDELAEYLKPTASSPSDGIVLAKAREIVGARTAPLDKARAIYDWIVDNTFRRAETRGCGFGNIAFMLESADLGGKCADINSLFVGLARAVGLPARFLRHQSGGLEIDEIARKVRRYHQGAALPCRGLHRHPGVVSSRPRRRSQGRTGGEPSR